MRKRHPNPRLAKIHRSYTVDEVASLFGVHRNSVREWVKRGLPTSDGRRPMLILGVMLILLGAQSFLAGLLGEMIVRPEMENAGRYDIRESVGAQAVGFDADQNT